MGRPAFARSNSGMSSEPGTPVRGRTMSRGRSMSIDGREGEAVAGGTLEAAHKHKWLVVTSDGYRQRLGGHPDAAAGAKGYIVKVYEFGAGHKVDVFWDNGKLLTGYQACEGVFDLLVAPSDEKEPGEAKTGLRQRVMGKLRNRSLSASGNLKEAQVEVMVGYLGKAPEAHMSGSQFTLWNDESPTMQYHKQQPMSAPAVVGHAAVQRQQRQHGAEAAVPPQPMVPAPVSRTHRQRRDSLPLFQPSLQAPAAGHSAAGGTAPPPPQPLSPARVLEQLQVPMPSPPPASIMGYQQAGKAALQQFAVPPAPMAPGGVQGAGEHKGEQGVSPSSSARNSDGGDSARLSAASTTADAVGNWDSLLC